MSEPRRPRTSKPKAKPKAKAKAKPKASARKSTPRPAPVTEPAPNPAPRPNRIMPVYVEPDPGVPTRPPVVPAPFSVRPTAPPAGPLPSNGLAVASLVSAVGGFTFVPLVGGLVATALGSLALKKEREDPTRYSAGGMAVAGVVIGFFTTLMPLLFVTLFTAKRITPIPFVLVVVYSAYVFHTATRGRATTGQKFAIIGGSIVTTIIAVAVAIGLAFGFYFLMQAIATEIGHAIGDAFSQMFDGIGDAFDGCADIDF